jgi:signal peptidase I
MLKLLPLLYCWYRMGAFTRQWAAPGAADEDFRAMRRATKTAFWIMLGFSLLGFIGPALLPSLRHSESAQTFSTITLIAGFALSLIFDIKAEILRQRGKGEKRQSIYFPPSWLKKSERFSKGVDKFLDYQRDLMPEPKLAAVLAAKEEYDNALRNPDKAVLEEQEKKVLKVCEAAVPEYNASPLKENVEVIVVAIIVALGIRAYYLQPFKIPTASMQPTLNGIIGTEMKDSEKKPNILTQAWQYVWNGRNYIECRVPKEWGEVELTHFQQTSKANFFTFTTLYFSNRESMTMYCPARQLLTPYAPPLNSGICVNMDVVRAAGGVSTDDNPQRMPFGFMRQHPATGQSYIEPAPPKLKGGDLIAKGYVESGDQLLVDKLSYHFRSPRRDEVFVFSTRDIPISPGRNLPPQHYIKRLVALPGDKVAIEAPKLLVNGAVVTAPGSGKVMSAENGYGGYTDHFGRPTPYIATRTDGPGVDLVFRKPGYTALGDNSGNSEDSRYWGPVWERNLVGPALFVYWPFANHWGLIP